MAVRVLLIDHYDSFTWNLAHLLAAVTGHLPTILAHDDVALLSFDPAAWDAVVLSPGPGAPDRGQDVRHSRVVLKPGVRVLGVCLGMQVITRHAGGEVLRAPEPRHGRISTIRHDGNALFAGVPRLFTAVRYHSLACRISDALEPLAWAEDGVLMALRHRQQPWYGVQFHPESVETQFGEQIIHNFLGALAGSPSVSATVPVRPRPRHPFTGEVLPPVLVEEMTWSDPEAACSGLEAPFVWLDGRASRFSILADVTGPLAYTLTHRAGSSELKARAEERRRPGSLWGTLTELLGGGIPSAGLPFNLGFMGVFGYELRGECGSPVGTTRTLPDAQLLFVDRALVFDHERRRAWRLVLDHPENRLWWPTPSAPGPGAVEPAPGPPSWRHDDAAYLARIARAQQWLLEGQSYELCLTNSVSLPAPKDVAALWVRLREINPAPFAALLTLPSACVVSSSPERFFSVRAGVVTASPIKGTARRSDDDASEREALRTSVKDRSENLMIVDLLRNDIGKVCRPGSVVVPSLYAIETHPRVHQMVSTVQGVLRPGVGAVDVLAAAFPPGSMTGAPKLRSMQLLEELEEGPRGYYSGALGYLSLCGDADLSVVIRTIVIHDDRASIGVGGAIVALSDPDAELAEMKLKAEVLLEALSGGGRPGA